MAALTRNAPRWAARFLSAPTARQPLPSAGRRHVRALRRRPVQVLYPQTGGEPQAPAPQPRPPPPPPPPPGQWADTRPGHRPPLAEQPSLRSASLPGLSYDKAIPGDKRLAKVVTIVKSKKFREQHGKILLEGQRLITDALAAGAQLQTLFFSTVESLKALPLDKLKRVQLIKVKFEEIKIWSDLVTPHGGMGIFRRPDHAKMKYPTVQQENTVPLSLICDNIRDPGNLGTILRSAVAAGCSKVLITQGCVDVWEPKVLRAGMGAHFRIPVVSNLEWEAIPNYLSSSTVVYVADHAYLGAGSSGQADNMDASGWVSTRQHEKQTETEYEDSDSDGEERDLPLELPDVGSLRYHDNWAQDQTALVIGGETHGLSLDALLLAGKTDGRRLYIPMSPSVDSLNSAMAASILLFEGRRQLLFRTAEAGCGGVRARAEPTVTSRCSQSAHQQR